MILSNQPSEINRISHIYLLDKKRRLKMVMYSVFSMNRICKDATITNLNTIFTESLSYLLLRKYINVN